MGALNSIEDEPKVLDLKLFGVNKRIKVDIAKLREAITFEDVEGDEESKDAVDTPVHTLEGETENDYLDRI
jgi:hypothetical protein